MKRLVWPMFAALALTGCVNGTISSNLSDSHPAHPQAQASPEASASPMLMAGSQGLVLPLSTNQTEMKHEEHQQKPASKGAQSRSIGTEHKHEHKKEEKK